MRPSRSRLRPAAAAAALSCLLALAACDRRATSPAEPSAPEPPRPAPAAAPAPAEGSSRERVEVVERTTGGAAAADRLPMIVAIHGLGDRPESLAELFSVLDVKARLIVPRGLTAYHDGYSWFPIVDNLYSDDVGQGILHAAGAIAATVARLSAERPTVGKPIITGFSQGGALSFAIALRHPEVVRVALPISGWVPPSVVPGAGGAWPAIFALHGEADPRVPIGKTREAISTLQRLGIKASLQGYPAVGHTVSPEMRRELARLIGEALHDSL